MRKEIDKHWQSLLLATIAIIFAYGTTLAQEDKSITARYGSRDPRTCQDTKAPARGAITAALALKYLNCQMDYLAGGGDLYLVENVKVEVGGGISYAAIMGQRSLSEIDTKQPVYPIRGSLLRYQCQNRLTAARVPDANCNTYNEPKAKGYCYKTTFGDWRCYMNDPDRIVRHDVPPPKGENNAAAGTLKDKSAGMNSKQPVNPKDTKQNIGTKVEPEAADRDENGFVKPDLSEMEKYFEIGRMEYDFNTLRFYLLVKMTKKTNVCQWLLTFYDADGLKIREDNFTGPSCSPDIGELTKIYSYTPIEMEMKKVKRITITRRPI